MAGALYVLSWLLAVVAVAVGWVVLLPFCVVICLVAMFYSTQGHRLGVRRRPRDPSALTR